MDKDNKITRKEHCYDTIMQEVDRNGGYLAISTAMQPTFCVIDDYPKAITFKALFIGNDDSSPLKLIDINDHVWDADDYICEGQMEHLAKIAIVQTYLTHIKK